MLFRVCFAELRNGFEVFWGRATFEGGGGENVTAERDLTVRKFRQSLCKPYQYTVQR